MSPPHAIETRYKGYRFRSRTEARWAVAFDHAGIAWEYEKEGYHLPSGLYLPDFWLPLNQEYFTCGHVSEPGYWFEVKASRPTEREVRLIEELRIETGHTAWIAAGPVGDHLLWCRHHSGRHAFEEDGTPEAEDYKDLTIARLCPFMYRTVREPRHGFVEAARSARFEHGERP